MCQRTSGEAEGMMGSVTCFLRFYSVPYSLLHTLHAFPISSFHFDLMHEVGRTTLILIAILNETLRFREEEGLAGGRGGVILSRR